MRPARRIKQAEELARGLKALFSSSNIAQFLQRTPPASLTAEQKAQLSHCSDVIRQLIGSLNAAPSLRLQLMDAMMKQQVACIVGRLITCVQQQPQQQLAAAGTTASMCAAGVHLLTCLALVAVSQTSESAGPCSLAEHLTQELDQSGKTCSRTCKCTAR
jgi:hypothetical protein